MRFRGILRISTICLAASLLTLMLSRVAVSSRHFESAETVHLPLIIKPHPPLQQIGFELIVDGIVIPTAITHAGDDRLFIAEKAGLVHIVENGTRLPTPFIDIRALTVAVDGSAGLLGMAFDPNYIENGRFFLVYTNRNDQTTLARFTVSANPNIANPTPSVLITVDQPIWPEEGNVHNAGDIHFGPDGYLYWVIGDGKQPGSAGPNHAQDLNYLLGKMARIDVSENATGVAPDCVGDGNGEYAIPLDNPFVTGFGDACGEIWASGLRNPWRFSFDRATGDMFIGDVGNNQYEEINHQPAGAPGGRNYGWVCYEGPLFTNSPNCEPIGDYTFPAYYYPHIESGCASVTGGYVYRGVHEVQMLGYYLFADFCDGKFYATNKFSAETPWQVTLVGGGAGNPTTFGEAANGELYVGMASGNIYRIKSAE
ncbi:MAG: PQQ-dependent sugar dehydrogenase [Anaerolineae bacterium]|nr:PQQ-dependent sugar dehydrogenase [Anaerolineae bacterium]